MATTGNAPLSLPKSSLLTKPREYRKVYEHGQRIRGHRFSLIYLPSGAGENRLGISIHGIKGGVRRNRLKRIVREFYRHHRHFLDWGRGSARPRPAMDVVLTIRNGFAPDSPQAITEAIRGVLTRHPVP